MCVDIPIKVFDNPCSYSKHFSVPVLDTTIAIQATPEKVWGYLSDIPLYTRWMTGIDRLIQTSEIPRGIGASFRATSKGPFRTRLEDRIVCTQWIENVLLTLTHHGDVRGQTVFRLIPIELGTRIRWQEEFWVPLGFPGRLLFAMLFRRTLRQTFTRDIRNLKSLVEGGL